MNRSMAEAAADKYLAYLRQCTVELSVDRSASEFFPKNATIYLLATISLGKHSITETLTRELPATFFGRRNLSQVSIEIPLGDLSDLGERAIHDLVFDAIDQELASTSPKPTLESWAGGRDAMAEMLVLSHTLTSLPDYECLLKVQCGAFESELDSYHTLNMLLPQSAVQEIIAAAQAKVGSTIHFREWL